MEGRRNRKKFIRIVPYALLAVIILVLAYRSSVARYAMGDSCNGGDRLEIERCASSTVYDIYKETCSGAHIDSNYNCVCDSWGDIEYATISCNSGYVCDPSASGYSSRYASDIKSKCLPGPTTTQPPTTATTQPPTTVTIPPSTTTTTHPQTTTTFGMPTTTTLPQKPTPLIWDRVLVGGGLLIVALSIFLRRRKK